MNMGKTFFKKPPVKPIVKKCVNCKKRRVKHHHYYCNKCHKLVNKGEDTSRK